jgi:LacI family transcriptional regulator
MTTKEVTIYDIAAKLNLSGATVSRALKDDSVVNEKAKKKIFAVADEMGY